MNAIITTATTILIIEEHTVLMGLVNLHSNTATVTTAMGTTATGTTAMGTTATVTTAMGTTATVTTAMGTTATVTTAMRTIAMIIITTIGENMVQTGTPTLDLGLKNVQVALGMTCLV